MSDSAQGPGWWQASDGKWYPPEQAPAAAAPAAPPPAYGPPPQQMGPPMGAPPMGYGPPPKQGMHGCLKAFLIVLALTVVLGVVAVIVGATLLDDAVDDFAEGDSDERDDIQDIECGEDDLGNMRATVTVENDSTERSNYIIQVNFVDGDRQLESTAVFINSVEPGQQAEGEASTATAAPGDFECREAGVQRFSDESGG